MTTNPDENTFPGSDAGLDAQLDKEIEAALGGKSLSDLIDETDAAATPSDKGPDGVRRGKVIAINKEDVFVDVGGRSQGVITLDQFEPDKRPQIGDVIEVLIDHYDEREGLLILTRQGVAQKVAWATIAVGDVVEARVTAVNKGGLECDLHGIRAFLPASQVDVVRIDDLAALIGQRLTCRITELDRRQDNVVLSRRKLLEEKAAEDRKKTMAELAEGQVRSGVVKTIMPFGAFVDIGGLDGLLHVSDMSYSRVRDPRDAVQVGQTLQVQVLKIEEGGNRISLGLKQLQPDPWTQVGMKYKHGMAVKGRVTSLADFGAFVEIEPGLEALLPIGEMTWKKRIRHPSEILARGTEVEVSILDVDPARRRMSVSLKAFEPDPWAGAERRYMINTIVPGHVTRVADFGAFVELEPGLEGLVHISELSDKPIQRPTDAVRPGQQVQVRVLSVSEADRRVSLSLKDVAPEAAPSAAVAEDAPKPRKKPKRPLRGGID